jgi:hypothetical protein
MKKNYVTKKYDVAGETTVTISQTGEVASIHDFGIHASRQGIWFTGTSEMIEDEGQLNELAKQIASAWKASKSFRPKLVSTTGAEL